MGNRPGWTKAWSLDVQDRSALHESGALFREIGATVTLEPGTDDAILAIGPTAAGPLLKRLHKEAGDLFRKNPRPAPSTPAAIDPGGLSLEEVLRKVPSHETAPEYPGDVLILSGQAKEAIEFFAALPYSHHLRLAEKIGWCWIASGQPAKAVGCLNPHEAQLSPLGLGVLGFALKDLQQSEYRSDVSKRMRAIATRLAQHSETLPRLALQFAIEETFEAEHAVPLIAKALKRYPAWPFALIKAAQWNHHRAGCFDGEPLAPRIEAALALDAHKNHESLMWAAVRMHHHSGDHERALAHVETLYAMSLDSSDSNPSCTASMSLAGAVLSQSLEAPEHRAQWMARFHDAREHLPAHLRCVGDRVDIREAIRSQNEKTLSDAVRQHIQRVEHAGPFDAETNLFSDSGAPVWMPGGEMESFDLASSLCPVFHILIADLSPEERGFIRFQEAMNRPIPEGDPAQQVQQEVNESLLDAAMESTHPLVHAAAARACVEIEPPNWRAAGRSWAHFVLWSHGEWVGNEISPIDAVSEISGTDFRAFIEGILVGFKENPELAKRGQIFHPDWKMPFQELDLGSTYLALAEACLEGDFSAPILYHMGGAHHLLKNLADAANYFDQCLKLEPTHGDALTHRLAVAASLGDAPRVQSLATVIGALAETDPRKPTLLESLAHARKALQRKDPKALLREEVSRFPDPITATVNYAEQPFTHFLLLQALLLASKAAPDEMILSPYGDFSTPFEPTEGFSQGIFDLMRAGLIGIDVDRSPATCVTRKKDERVYYTFGDVFWKISPRTRKWLVDQQLELSQGRWPAEWCKQLPEIAQRLARCEIIRYVTGQADDRNWPHPEDMEKLDAAARKLVEHVSVSQALSICWAAAGGAANFRSLVPASLKSVSSHMVNLIGKYLDTRLEKGWDSKGYNRDRNCPRTSISRALYEKILEWDDRGFTTRIADLPFPMEEPVKKSRKSKSKLH